MAIRNTSLGGTDFQDTGSTTLNGALNNSATTITVTSTASFKSGGGILRIDSELITYTGVSGGTQFTGCTRGAYGSTAASHSNGATVTEREIPLPDDLNDTFDALYNKVKTITAFWLISDLRTTYDDFDSYSVGAFTTNSLWTVTKTFDGTVTIASSTNAGGSGKELVLYASGDINGNSGTAEVVSIGLADDKHKHIIAQVYCSDNGGGSAQGTTVSAQIKIGSQSYSTIFERAIPDNTGATYAYFDITVIALGSNNYDVYVGGKKIFSNVNEANPQIGIKVIGTGDTSFATGNITMYIDDVYESAYAV